MRLPPTSVRARLIAMTLVIVLLVVSLLTFGFTRQSAAILAERTHDQLGQLVGQSLRILKGFLASQSSEIEAWSGQPLVRSLAAAPEMRPIFQSGVDALFDHTLAASPWLLDVQIVRDTSVIYARTDFTLRLEAARWLEIVRAVPPQTPQVWDMTGPESGKRRPVLIWKSAALAATASAPAPADEQDATPRHLVVVHDYAKLSDHLFDDTSFEGGGFVALTAMSKSGLAFSLPAKAQGPDLQALEQEVLPWYRYADIPPVWRDLVLVARRLGDTQLGAMAVVPRSAIEKPVARLMRLSIGAGMVVSVVGLLITLVFAEALSRPVRRLTKTVMDLASGDLKARAETLPEARSRDEIGTLALNFNVMASRLETYTEGLARNVALLALLEEENRQVASVLTRAELKEVIQLGLERLSQELRCRVELALPAGEPVEGTLSFKTGSGLEYQLPWPLSDGTLTPGSAVQTVTVGAAILYPCQGGRTDDLIAHGPMVLVTTERLAAGLREGVDSDRAVADQILRAYSLAVSGALRTIATLAVLTRHARTTAEVEAAQAVQEALLPRGLSHERIKVSAAYRPAGYIGGDWYGYHFDARRGVIYFYIGDITGHSFSSALMTGVVYGGIHAANSLLSRTQHEDAGQETTERHLLDLASMVNAVVRESGQGRLMMSFMATALTLETGQLLCLNAGHRPALRLRPSIRKLESIPGIPGSLLGLDEDPVFRLSRHPIEPNDMIVLYTDGLLENGEPEGRMSRWRRLQKSMAQDADIEAVRRRIFEATGNLWLEEQPIDDTTLLLFQWLG